MSARRRAALLVAAALSSAAVVAPGHAAPGARIEQVTRSATGGPTNGSPGVPEISADGRWVVFSSGADNIVPPDQNNEYDIFLLDRRTGRVRNLTPGADGTSDAPRISADGRRVVFVSLADNLVPGSADPAVATHTFVWTRGAGVRQVDVAVDGGAPDAASGSPDISADGRVVVFTSRATDLTTRAVTPHQAVYRTDLDRGTTAALDARSTIDAAYPSVDADGDRVAYNDVEDVLLWRRGQPRRNLTPGPAVGGLLPSISASGNEVAYQDADGVWFVDVRRGRTRPVTAGAAGNAAISDDGRFVTFNADTDLVPGDTNNAPDAYRWAAAGNGLLRLSGSAAPASGFGRLSRDGSLVVFVSDDLLVPGDTNQFRDVFLRRLG